MNDLTKDELRQRAESAQAAGDKWFTADTAAVLGLVAEVVRLKEVWLEDGVRASEDRGDLLKERDDWKARAEAAEAELARWFARSEAVVDIYFDGIENAPEHRSYMDGAFPNLLDNLRVLVSAKKGQL